MLDWTKVTAALKAFIAAFTTPMTQTYSQTPPSEPQQPNPDVLAPDWSIPANAKHNVRVLCDLAGLTLYQKDVITACIQVESNFRINAVHANKNVAGKTLSTDYSLCQINDYYHIGPGKDFPSVDYVYNNPETVVNWMIKMYLEGHLNQWVSYTSGSYLQYMPNRG